MNNSSEQEYQWDGTTLFDHDELLEINPSLAFVDEFDEDIEPIKISEIKEVLDRVLIYCKENNLKRAYYDINDSMATYILTDVNKIDDSNLKKLSIFLEFKI